MIRYACADEANAGLYLLHRGPGGHVEVAHEAGGEALRVQGLVGGVVQQPAAEVLTLSCLSEEEWQAVGPTLGMGADDRGGLQCVLAELGGPEGLAAALQPGAGPPTVFFEASAACGPQMTQGESGTVAPASLDG